MTARNLSLAVIVSLIAVACATGGGLSKNDVFNFYAPVRQLNDEI